MNTANRIVQALDELNVLCDSYLKNEGQARYLAGLETVNGVKNKHDAINRLRCTVIAGLPAIRLDRYADAKRARKIV